MALKIIRNSKRTRCACGTVHDFITKVTDHRPCSTPLAYDSSVVEKVARMVARGRDDVEDIPSSTDVILADGSRKLPVRDGTPHIRHYITRERMA